MNTQTFASESGHWYTKTGEPCYEVPYADPKKGMRATTIKDARKLGLVPSTTSVTRILAKPALTNWLIGQGVWQALTLTRLPDETDDQFVKRAVEMHAETGRLAAERGTALHGAIERGDTTGEWAEHVANVKTALLAIGINPTTGRTEHSFADPLGFGGKVDLCSDAWVVDYKSKDTIGDKTADELAYDEHATQLAAYALGLQLRQPRCVNVFVGVGDAKVVVKEWTPAEIARGERMFLACLELWKLKNNYNGHQ
jgi:hypothetical protein